MITFISTFNPTFHHVSKSAVFIIDRRSASLNNHFTFSINFLISLKKIEIYDAILTFIDETNSLLHCFLFHTYEINEKVVNFSCKFLLFDRNFFNYYKSFHNSFISIFMVTWKILGLSDQFSWFIWLFIRWSYRSILCGMLST